MNLDKRQLIFFGGIAVLVIALILVFVLGTEEPPVEKQRVDLEIWGIYDPPEAFGSIIESYKKAFREDSSVVYVQKQAGTYEQELINALAAGRGPDIFMVHNTWIPKHFEKLVPADPTRLSVAEYQQAFPVAIQQDFIAEGNIYASPLYLDTLAMYYNEDMFEEEAIVIPPKLWDDVATVSRSLRRLNPQTGQLERSGIALGGTDESINRATDIMALLMMQQGSQMVNEDFTKAALTTSKERGSSFSENPATKALDFYTQFANPVSPYYSWSENFSHSIDAFANEQLAIMFNYSHQRNALEQQNPFLRFAIAEMPQFNKDNSVNYASYWGLAVSSQINPSKAVLAWDFIKFATMDPKVAAEYMIQTKRPPALKSLIQLNVDDPNLGVFARQAGRARSWRQPDNLQVEKIFSEMIENVLLGRESSRDAARTAQQRISELIDKSRFLKEEEAGRPF